MLVLQRISFQGQCSSLCYYFLEVQRQKKVEDSE